MLQVVQRHEAQVPLPRHASLPFLFLKPNPTRQRCGGQQRPPKAISPLPWKVAAPPYPPHQTMPPTLPLPGDDTLYHGLSSRAASANPAWSQAAPAPLPARPGRQRMRAAPSCAAGPRELVQCRTGTGSHGLRAGVGLCLTAV